MKATARYLAILTFAAVITMMARSSLATATPNAVEVFLPIDVSESGSSVIADFKVTDERLYIFYLNVHYRNEQQRQQIVTLVGDGGRSRNGEYANPGIVLPIRLKLATSSMFEDVTGNVKGVAGHGLGPHLSGEYVRQIHAAILKKGLYQMKITIPQGFAQFKGVECAISVGVQPHTGPILK